MIKKYSLRTETEGFYDITREVKMAVKASGINEGICTVFCPHTTAGVTINENADPDVVRDMLLGLAKAYPDRPEFRHMEGNSHAHLKASALGAAEMILINDGRLLLGTWQGIYFCEFDGPRSRSFYVQVLGS